jgi:hypothetical protein
MINAAIDHICFQLNQHLTKVYGLNEDVVVISNILEQDGSVSTHINNKIVVSLVNIEKDSIPFRQQTVGPAGATRSLVTARPLYFNLYLMVASYFNGSNYQEGLKFISTTLRYFQGQSVFNQQNSPGLDSGIEKLILEIENLDLNNLSNLWGVLSGKYLPSVLYKVRMISVDAEAVIDQPTGISQPDSLLDL